MLLLNNSLMDGAGALTVENGHHGCSEESLARTGELINIMCDENMDFENDDALVSRSGSAECAGTSQQFIQMQPVMPHRVDADASCTSQDLFFASNSGITVDNNNSNNMHMGFPIFHKMKREWRFIGVYGSDAAMNEVRKREKVSKRKSVTQVTGTKVFYRCNNWRRTNCNFRMYAMYHQPDKIVLYASGEHDHTTKNPHYVPRNYKIRKCSSPFMEKAAVCKLVADNEVAANSGGYNATPINSQQQVLTQFVMNATANSRNLFGDEQENVFETAQEQNASACPPLQDISYIDKVGTSMEIGIYESPYRLSDLQSLAELHELASEIDYTFTYDGKRNDEYCFQSNKADLKNRSVVFQDLGPLISVTERLNGVDQDREEWYKADWGQFLWAVRGKCLFPPSS